MEEKSGLADATWTVEKERLGHTVVLHVVVEHRLQQRSGHQPPLCCSAPLRRRHLPPPPGERRGHKTLNPSYSLDWNWIGSGLEW